MSTLGFDNYVEPLKTYLQKYRESIKGDRTSGAEGFEEGAEEAYGIYLNCFCIMYKYLLSSLTVDCGASNNTVNVLSADGQLNQQANVIYATYPGAQITQFQLG